jgi:hypothetical protein
VLDPSQSDACCAELRPKGILVCTARKLEQLPDPDGCQKRHFWTTLSRCFVLETNAAAGISRQYCAVRDTVPYRTVSTGWDSRGSRYRLEPTLPRAVPSACTLRRGQQPAEGPEAANVSFHSDSG